MLVCSPFILDYIIAISFNKSNHFNHSTHININYDVFKIFLILLIYSFIRVS